MGLTDEKHVWRKGDLCRRWVGIISRVVQVLPAKPDAKPGSKQRHVRLKLTQATEFMGELGRQTNVVMAYQCKPLTLVDLGTEYMKLGNFIREEAKRLGMEDT